MEEWLGEEFGYDPADPETDMAAAQRAIRLAAAKGVKVPVRSSARPEPMDDLGGVEIRSCRNGDLFLRWDENGRIRVGLEPEDAFQLPAGLWSVLREERAALTGTETHGDIICDYLRLMSSGPDLHRRAAPAMLPADLQHWLSQLATALEQSGAEELGKVLSSRLTQFASPGNK